MADLALGNPPIRDGSQHEIERADVGNEHVMSRSIWANKYRGVCYLETSKNIIPTIILMAKVGYR